MSTITFPTAIPPLDGNVYSQDTSLKRRETELLLENIGPRIIVLLDLGNSSRKLVTLTPGLRPLPSAWDMRLMEEAIGNPLPNMGFLFGHKWSVDLFHKVRDEVLRKPIHHTPRYEALWNILGKRKFTQKEIQEFIVESQKSKMPWNELKHALFATEQGRKLWSIIRPLYLERQKAYEEMEVQEFRSVRGTVSRIIVESNVRKAFVGTTSSVGVLEILSRDIVKQIADQHVKVGKLQTVLLKPEGEHRIDLGDYSLIP